MPSIRFRLDKPTLSGLAEQVRREYGPDARIVDTEETVIGGFAGLFGRKVVDVTVDLPDKEAVDGSHEFDMAKRVGLAALLDDADARDFGPAGAEDPFELLNPGGAAGPEVSTQGGEFASVLDALRIDTEAVPTQGGGTPARAPQKPSTARPDWAAKPETAPTALVPRRTGPLVLPRTAPPIAPAAPLRMTTEVVAPPSLVAEAEAAAVQATVWATPTPRSRVGRTVPGAPPPQRTRAGDLLLLVGLHDDAVGVANAVRDRLQRGYVCDGGSVEGFTRRRVDDRRGAMAARAYGVRSDQPVIVAYGIGDGDLLDPRFAGLLTIDSDQSWLVVDGARPEDQTLAWAGRLRGRLQVDAVARVGAKGGPDPVAALGLPPAWADATS
ncbi:hypothetical protein QDR37_07975 [Amnibacterium sp. CER49]|uniref:hypothetical protein n=1 Tax=Amnibacterium sp. CER49 TaxID=3039161 RepID=UPI0024489A6C|nr:hypothetical protein [Amnibacterium sp. CER49]MDH2443877.1 hypothetical protein [Amnibacterium sp. CER49]